jgi:AraC-like DNA-binding protein
MSPIINSEHNDQQIVLTRPFFAQHDRQTDRDLHSHNCVEISYVITGNADHVLILPDGTTAHHKLSRGNYMILDTNVRHAYKNCSADFSLMNVLFQKSFLRGDGEDPARVDARPLTELICTLFAEFPYEKLPQMPINRICFDQDESVLALIHICHTTSRKHYPIWKSAVQNALSLILLQTLYSCDRYSHPHKQTIIDTVKQYVEAHYAEDVALGAICAAHFYSLPYVSHRFKELCGCSFEQYLRSVRIKRAGELLLSTTLPVGEIAERCGYTSPRAFRRAFIDVTGVPPTTFKKNYRT